MPLGSSARAEPVATTATVLRVVDVYNVDIGPPPAPSTRARWSNMVERSIIGYSLSPPGRTVAQRLRRIVQLAHLYECLNINSFWSLAQARVDIGD